MNLWIFKKLIVNYLFLSINWCVTWIPLKISFCKGIWLPNFMRFILHSQPDGTDEQPYDECLIRQRVHYWSLKRKNIIIRSAIHRRFWAHYRSGGYQQEFRTSRILFFFLSELDLSSCFRLIKFVLHVLKYIASQIEVCAFRESRVFICISSHNPQISRQIFNNMLIQCRVPISSFKPK
jgi:hypothetical protein